MQHNILIVDDDTVFRLLVNHLLTDEGFSVREARDGREALIEIAGHRPDLMLLDLDMPRLDGHGVIAELEQQEQRGFPIIVVSGTIDEGRLNGRVEALIAKPLDLDHLVRRVHLLVDGAESSPPPASACAPVNEGTL